MLQRFRKRAHHDQALLSRIRKILKAHGRLHRDADRLSEHEDLYEAGMSPHASAHVMLALEHEFKLEFPDQIISRAAFGSIGNIAAVLADLDDD